MGLIIDAIQRHINNKKENRYLDGEIDSITDSYSSVEIKLTQMKEYLINLYSLKGKNNKRERLSIEEKIFHYLHDLNWIHNNFMKRFENFEEMYKKSYSKIKTNKTNQAKLEKVLSYKKEIRKLMEQIYSNFKSKGKKIEDIEYKLICKQMLEVFQLVPQKTKEEFIFV